MDTISLPRGFEWYTPDIDEITQFLHENYTEDFHYTKQYLIWAFGTQNWMVGIRGKYCVGFICASQLHGITVVNFLCVHRKWRGRRIGAILTREIKRILIQNNVLNVIWATSKILPSPSVKTTYYHRPLSETGMRALKPGVKISMLKKIYRLPHAPNLRLACQSDVPQITQKLNAFLDKYTLHPHFTQFEIDSPVCAYVRVHNNEIVDFVSFFELRFGNLRCAYLYYYFGNDLPDLLHNALTAAARVGFDVFNALNIMDNNLFLNELKFECGTGNLYYYGAPQMPLEKTGYILL
jgi:glycylpeptide N-tetradecanoyltransferase